MTKIKLIIGEALMMFSFFMAGISIAFLKYIPTILWMSLGIVSIWGNKYLLLEDWEKSGVIIWIKKQGRK